VGRARVLASVPNRYGGTVGTERVVGREMDVSSTQSQQTLHVGCLSTKRVRVALLPVEERRVITLLCSSILLEFSLFPSSKP